MYPLMLLVSFALMLHVQCGHAPDEHAPPLAVALPSRGEWDDPVQTSSGSQ
jgi:hypothetical protein